MNSLVENWWKQAQRDLQSAKNSFDSKDYYASAFWSHQSVEKGLKSLRIKKFNDLPKIHNLIKLSRELNAPEEIIKKCSKVNPVYTEVRYPEGKTLPADKINKVEAETDSFNCKRGLGMDRKKPVIKEIERFYRNISLKMPLQKMIFFGSRAKGKARKDSDIDLLLVSSKFKGVRPLSWSPELYLKWDSDYAVDLICLTPTEFNHRKKELGVVQEAIKEGIEIDVKA